AAYEGLSRSSDALRSRLDEREIIYGVNTGFGGSADARTKQTQELQRVLIRELHYGITGPNSRDPRSAWKNSHAAYDLEKEQSPDSLHLPKTWTRASILIRLNSLAKGCSAIRPTVVDRLLDLLAHDIIPVIPLRGSISASGDLSPLSYIGGAIQAKPTIRIHSGRGEELFADQAIVDKGLEPVVLDAKEGLAIVNGTAISCGSGALALSDAHVLAVLSQVLTAMTVEALHGTMESFDPFFSMVRPHPGQRDASMNMHNFLTGSKLTHVNTGEGSVLRQDRYAVRTAPQWIGPVLEDLVLAHQQITIECNSATDNPLVNERGTMLHGGNFQAKSVTSAMEKVRQGNCTIGRMLFAQCTELINPSTNRGLPPNLVIEDPSTSYIFKGTDISAAALQAELGFLSNPANHVQTAEMGNQSLNSLALISARYTHTSNDVLTQMMAAHLIAVCQALDLRAMKIQFMDTFRTEFGNLVEDLNSHYRRPGAENVTEDSERFASLWHQFDTKLDSTAALDGQDRFKAIAQTLRTVLLEDPSTFRLLDPLTTVESFQSTVERSLRSSWCAHRDAYVVHGDASGFLGLASRKMYLFIRKDLGVPLLCKARIQTPVEMGPSTSEAPTVGSYTSIVYRALREGRFLLPLIDILETTPEHDGHVSASR
ncbi:PAL-domain-containing protein, partial [Bimuria novae-zelandiae CBS 107.79]